MAEKELNTRIQLKYDTFARWDASDIILKKGEVAIAVIPEDSGIVQGEPAVVMKIGDGEKTFHNLPFISARAADIYSWARATTKPTYEAAEITGIDNYIANYVNTQMGISVDTDTQYQLDKVDDYTYNLQSKGKTDTAWANVAGSTITIPNDTAAITSLQNLVGNQSVNAQIASYVTALDLANTYELKGAKDAEIKAAKDAADAAQAKADDTATKVTTLIGSDANKSVRAIANEELTAALVPADAQTSLDTLQEIADWIQDHPGDATAMNTAITALQTKVDTGNKNVSVYVADAIAALNIGNYALAADLAALAGRVATIEAKTTAWDAAEQNAKDHADGLNAAMNTRMQAVEGEAHEHGNKALLDAYTQTETNLADAVAKKHEHANIEQLNTITAAKITAWDAKANAADLAAIATSGNVNDLVQTPGDVLVFNCGDSTI